MTLPRALMVTLAALFALYQVALGIYDLDRASHPGPALFAMALYLLTVMACLLPVGGIRMPLWLAWAALAVAIALPPIVSSQLEPGGGPHGYSTWYVASCGTLMTVVAARRRPWIAWVGISFLVVYTAVWAGPVAIVTTGVVGSIAWVGVATALTRALRTASRDAAALTAAGREAVQWRAAQDAHLYERRNRLAQTSRLAGPMLRRIVDRRGQLNETQRLDCRRLEAVLRDEIRGRALLDDRVREAVIGARRRGATVTLLDEGSLDELSAGELDRVRGKIAAAIRSSRADRIIARTVADGSPVAVTVVGLRSPDQSSASALGHEESDDDVELWLEIERTGTRGARRFGGTIGDETS